MSTHDLADVVATLSFSIATDLGLPDTPATESEMREQVSGWLADERDVAPPADTRQAAGMGFGLDMLTPTALWHEVFEALLKTLLRMGLDGVVQTLQHRPRRGPLPQFDQLIAQISLLETELQQWLVKLGFDEERAHELATTAVLDLAKKAVDLPKSGRAGATARQPG
ncbi:MAG: hypothetical protein ABSC06_31600 [Rhodopila sp.]|jgi:hypothetical protein